MMRWKKVQKEGQGRSLFLSKVRLEICFIFSDRNQSNPVRQTIRQTRNLNLAHVNQDIRQTLNIDLLVPD